MVSRGHATYAAKYGKANGYTEEASKACATYHWLKYYNSINDGKGNEGTVYSTGYDKVKVEFQHNFSSITRT